jgi:two-component system, OmpR family, sensor histidine kinase VicK
LVDLKKKSGDGRTNTIKQNKKKLNNSLKRDVFFRVIDDPTEASRIYINLVQSTKNEASLILPNCQAMEWEHKLGITDYLINASRRKEIPVRIICPLGDKNSKTLEYISTEAPNIKILNGEKSPFTLLIADKEKCFGAELRVDDADSFLDSIRYAIYSNSKSMVALFKLFFEIFWNKSEIYEQLRIQSKLQKDFINVAAHELRTPVTPILIMATALKSELEAVNEQGGKNESDYVKVRKKDFSIITHSAFRLKQLTDDILDAATIETRTLEINKEQFDLTEVLNRAVNEFNKKQEIEKQEEAEWRKDVKVYNQFSNNYIIDVEADKGRIMQVIFNLLSNALKFTEKGNIYVTLQTKGNDVIVNVRDSGVGIKSEVIPRLFTKFATKSFQGTGLGLFISKSIVESHGGRIWAKNNYDGRGATFSFTLPVFLWKKRKK